MSAVFVLSVRQLTGRWRLLVTIGLAAIAVVLTITMSFLSSDQEAFRENFVEGVLDALLIGGILPIIMMVLATTSFGTEVEDRTLSYLVLRPISKWEIVIPKFAAAVIVGGLIVLVSGAVSVGIAFDGSAKPIIAVALAMIAGVIAYGAVFTWTGLITTRPLYYALAYVLIWEAALTNIFDGIRYLSIRAFTLTVLNSADEARFPIDANRLLDAPEAIGGVVIVTVVFLALTIRRLGRMDVP